MEQTIELYTLYRARLLRDPSFDAVSPPNPPTIVTSQPTEQNLKAINRSDPRPIVFSSFDPLTKIGTIFTGSSLKHVKKNLHRWVPVIPARRMNGQPLCRLETDPPQTSEGYINFAYILRVKVHFGLETLPISTKIDPHLNNAPASEFEKSPIRKLPPGESAKLERLHADYWKGKRYHSISTLHDANDNDHSEDGNEQSGRDKMHSGSSRGAQTPTQTVTFASAVVSENQTTTQTITATSVAAPGYINNPWYRNHARMRKLQTEYRERKKQGLTMDDEISDYFDSDDDKYDSDSESDSERADGELTLETLLQNMEPLLIELVDDNAETSDNLWEVPLSPTFSLST
jgi:hypothetical protein